MENEKIYGMLFSKIYDLLVAKAVRKERTKEEVDTIIKWLTGYSDEQIKSIYESDITYGDFFLQAPELNQNRKRITGSICGVKLAEIEEPLMLEIRYLDKLIDELAKGKSMDKILRK